MLETEREESDESDRGDESDENNERDESDESDETNKKDVSDKSDETHETDKSGESGIAMHSTWLGGIGETSRQLMATILSEFSHDDCLCACSSGGCPTSTVCKRHGQSVSKTLQMILA